MKIHVSVPASTSNLGPGFDVFGMALDVLNEVRAESRRDGIISVDPGAGAPPALHDADRNMVVRGYTSACDRLDLPPSQRGVTMICVNRIPLARGLGSSAAAALAGVLVANALHHARWRDGEILDIVTGLEGHPDNAAAALLGGLVICAAGAPAVHVPVHADLKVVLYIPDFEVLTADSRRVVPATFDRADAVFNLGRCALLVHALASRKYHLLRTAMEDRWHQGQRTALFPALPQLIDAAQAAGARGAALSGAGPTILALTDGDPGPIAQSMRAAAHVAGVSGTTMTCAISDDGAKIETSV